LFLSGPKNAIRHWLTDWPIFRISWLGTASTPRSISYLFAGPVRKVLLAAARPYHADLLVMGAYGHSRTRQVVFGGFTRSVLETADLAVFLMH